MRTIGFVLAMVLSWGAAHAADVSFANVESYIDPSFDRPRSQKNLRAVQDRLREIFAETAAKYLAPGQALTVEVTGIDLAGRLEPTLYSNDIRIMSGATWPRLEFNYTVTENGAVVASGQASLQDRNYLEQINARPQGERLRYEREMISHWFRKTFAGQASRN